MVLLEKRHAEMIFVSLLEDRERERETAGPSFPYPSAYFLSIISYHAEGGPYAFPSRSYRRENRISMDICFISQRFSQRRQWIEMVQDVR